MNILATPPKRAVEYRIYRVIIKQPDINGLVIGRFEVAARDREQARKAGERWCTDGGRQVGFNCHVQVMRKIVDREPATILVAQ